VTERFLVQVREAGLIYFFEKLFLTHFIAFFLLSALLFNGSINTCSLMNLLFGNSFFKFLKILPWLDMQQQYKPIVLFLSLCLFKKVLIGGV